MITTANVICVGCTPLHRACAVGDPDLVQHILQHGANVEEKDTEGRTPLFYAVRSYSSATVKTVLAHGGDISVRNSQGIT